MRNLRWVLVALVAAFTAGSVFGSVEIPRPDQLLAEVALRPLDQGVARGFEPMTLRVWGTDGAQGLVASLITLAEATTSEECDRGNCLSGTAFRVLGIEPLRGGGTRYTAEEVVEPFQRRNPRSMELTDLQGSDTYTGLTWITRIEGFAYLLGGVAERSR